MQLDLLAPESSVATNGLKTAIWKRIDAVSSASEKIGKALMECPSIKGVYRLIGGYSNDRLVHSVLIADGDFFSLRLHGELPLLAPEKAREHHLQTPRSCPN